MKFEYVIVWREGSDLVEVQAAFDKFGRDGWELVSAEWIQVPRSQVGRQDISGVFIFKRCLETPTLMAEVRDDQLTPKSVRRFIEEMSKIFHPKSERGKESRTFIFPECERCEFWRVMTGGCAKAVIPGCPDCEKRCVRGTISPPAAESQEAQSVETEGCEEVRQLKEDAKKTLEFLHRTRGISEQPDEPRPIRPLFLCDVAICTSGSCEQFDIVKDKCSLVRTGSVGAGSVCPVWYKREGKDAPRGIIIRFAREPSGIVLKNTRLESIISDIVRVMDALAWYESCNRGPAGQGYCGCVEARYAIVDIVLQAIERAGYQVRPMIG